MRSYPAGCSDAVFEAAIDYGAEVGLYNNDTSRVLQFSRAELIETAHTRKPEFNIGEGKDMVTIRARHFGDKNLPVRIRGRRGSLSQKSTTFLFIYPMPNCQRPRGLFPAA